MRADAGATWSGEPEAHKGAAYSNGPLLNTGPLLNAGVCRMSVRPDVGKWYRSGGGDAYEVVALDESDGTVEVQYFDGTVAEFELEDWEAQRKSGEIEDAEEPEDWTGSVDIDVDDEEEGTAGRDSPIEGSPRRAGGLDDLDLFEAADSSHANAAGTESPGTDGVIRG
jgi:hypothetical protein